MVRLFPIKLNPLNPSMGLFSTKSTPEPSSGESSIRTTLVVVVVSELLAGTDLAALSTAHCGNTRHHMTSQHSIAKCCKLTMADKPKLEPLEISTHYRDLKMRIFYNNGRQLCNRMRAKKVVLPNKSNCQTQSRSDKSLHAYFGTPSGSHFSH